MRKLIIALLILVCGFADAQTCTGGLGDPIVDITFGSGRGFGPALGPGITDMTYIQTTCPEDGYYTIVSSTTNCFNGTWLNVTSDHTGDPNGYFMLINASYQPSDFYVQTISGLCAGTTYQFAAWVLNMVSVPGELEPNITFSIESTNGTVLGSYNTGNIPSTGQVNWVQYGFYFNTPPGIDSVVLRMTNNASGGDGNDLALDDITFRAAGPSIQTNVAGFTGDTVTLCQNDTRTLTFNTTVENCYPTAVYQWQQSPDAVTWADVPGAVAQTYLRSPSGPGIYYYRLTVSQAGNIGLPSCSVASGPVMVDVIPNPSPAVTIAAPSDSSCAGIPVRFTATPDSGGASPGYQWMVNGIDAGGDSAVFTDAGLNSGDVVRCVMTSDAVCVIDPVVASNAITMIVTPIPVSSVSIAASAGTICQDSLVQFTATPVNGGAAPSYQWTVNGAAAGGDSAVFTDAGLNNGDVVSCVMTAGLTCAVPDTAGNPVTMVVYPLPVIVLTADTVIAGGKSLRLDPAVTGDIASYVWAPAAGLDDAASADPLATPAGNTDYRLTVVSTQGCTASATEAVEVYYQLAMPGAFTPNGDGRNDVFRVPPTVPVVVRRLAVYNRDGALMFQAGNAAVGWDGTFNGHAQPAGVYVWELEYVDPLTRRVKMARGTVVLVR